MIESYLFPIRYALLTFPVVAFFFTLPFLIIQYRVYGYVHRFRGVVLYSFLLYLLTAYYLVILPLPDTIHTCTGSGDTYTQWTPFRFVQDFLKETRIRLDEPATYIGVIRERAFWQVVFNILLLVPFGFVIRYYFRFKWVFTCAAAFGLSLFFEWTQWTGLYGIYDCPYRLFDVDDLMLNTAGGAIGGAIAVLMSRLLPSLDQLDDDVDLKAMRVGFVRRFIAFQTDWVLLVPFAMYLLYIGEPVYFAALIFGYFIVLPYLTNGFTAGKYFVRIRLRGRGEDIKFNELLIRYGLLYFVIGGANCCVAFATVQQLQPLYFLPLLLAVACMDVMFVIHLLIRAYRRDKGLFYEMRSGTYHEIK
ncbi:VanZ family protein [Paenibacillus sp. OAS669]|uniref:VanZ family protein n=1 Tax=Paenibacillus sp. OAS669 TaxID=2663821 RepID=UPI00178B26F6|nr:VanZ family protein [Paenibacillus sp. OAS669]MBE1443084.1 glycopeptide antibiotics resistance protein [Paenibacillus sp. OAS669]